MILILLAVSICLAASPSLPAQDVTFRTTVDRTVVSAGERIVVGFVLSGSQSGKNLQPPDFRDFSVLSGPNTSTSIQMINGSVTSSVTYGYILQPQREGSLTIGPASIEYGGKRYTTAPVTVTVSRQAPGSQTGSGGQQGGRAAGSDVGDQIADNLLLRVELDRRTVYQGEQLTATYKIYTRVNVVNYNLAKVPAFTGFWSEDIDVPREVQLTTETLDGKQYRVGILKKVALFPQRSGTLEIGPMNVECVVQVQSKRRSNDIFDQFFNDPFFGNVRNVNHTVTTRVEKVSVKPLPSAGVPEGFGGAVGKFTLENGVDRQNVSENEAVTYRVKIAGTGNIELLEAPELSVSSDIDRYDPKVSDNIDKQRGRISGSRTFEYLLIPRHPGAQRIPPVVFSYFDPEKKSYVTLTGKEVPLSVSRGTGGGGEVAAGAGISREDVRLLGEDIRFIKSDELSLARKGSRFAGSPLFFVSAAGPVVCFALFLLIIRRREKILGDVAGLRSRKARNVAKKRLARAKQLLSGGNGEEFYTEVSKALWGYCADKLGMPPSELSLESIRDGLAARDAGQEVLAEVGDILAHCDYARFAPASDHRGMEEIFERSEKVILRLEGGLR